MGFLGKLKFRVLEMSKDLNGDSVNWVLCGWLASCLATATGGDGMI